VCSELCPDQRHRNPHRPQSLVGRSARTSYSLVETWSVNFANCGERAGCASDARWRRIAPARKELRNGSNKSEREPTSGHSTNYGSAHLVPASPDIGRTFSWLPSHSTIATVTHQAAAIVVFAVMPISSHCCSRPKSGLIVNSPPPRSWPKWPVRTVLMTEPHPLESPLSRGRAARIPRNHDAL
jgi:hypothetical protein